MEKKIKKKIQSNLIKKNNNNPIKKKSSPDTAKRHFTGGHRDTGMRNKHMKRCALSLAMATHCRNAH